MRLRVNGALQSLPAGLAVRRTLLEYLREDLRLTGTKLGCGTGGCGACTVVVEGRAVNSCITPAVSVVGLNVVTVEGVALTQPHFAQQLAEHHASQCGFCTPGFVCAAYPAASQGTDVAAAISGNICRCTGYRPLLSWARAVQQQRWVPLPQLSEAAPLLVYSDAAGDSYCRPSSTDELEAVRMDERQQHLVDGPQLLFSRSRRLNPEPLHILDIVELGQPRLSEYDESTALGRHLQSFGTPTLRSSLGLQSVRERTDVSPLLRMRADPVRVLKAGPTLKRQICVAVAADGSVEGACGGGRLQFSLGPQEEWNEQLESWPNAEDKANFRVLIANARLPDCGSMPPLPGTQGGTQTYQAQESFGATPHLSALKHASGTATFVDDLPAPSNVLHAAHVRSPANCGFILEVDAQEALQMPGVHCYVDARDLAPLPPRFKAVNDTTERVFSEKYVRSRYEVIGLIGADTPELAAEAAAKVRVRIEETAARMSIDEAVRDEFEFPYAHAIGVPVEQLQGDEWTTVELGSQLHFYMEPHALQVSLEDGGEDIRVDSMTQCVMKTQAAVAGVLGVSNANVDVVTRRAGGAFGGKETLSTFMAARMAVLARKSGRPVRMLLSREEDSETNGKRHPFRGRFRVHADEQGVLQAAEMELLSDGGATISTSRDVLDRALAHAGNSYAFPRIHVSGRALRTNTVSNTAFRGFGAPQSQFVCEEMIDKVARDRGLQPEEVRERNLVQGPTQTIFGQSYVSPIMDMWQEMKAAVDWASVEPEEHGGRYVRGRAMIPTTYGISFPVSYLNAGSAYVRIYTDGSVLVTHSAIEMGQGVNVKMAAVAAQALGVDISRIRVEPSSAKVIANPPPTAASVGSDLSGGAVLDACLQLRDRLAAHPGETWEQRVTAAYQARTNLAQVGHYKVPHGASYDWERATGEIYTYFTAGVGYAAVTLDTQTGHWRCDRARVLMDVGRSLNPAIDIGQVEGAWAQGMGLYTTEEVTLDEQGRLTSRTPLDYQVIMAHHMPHQFDVTLWPDSTNDRAVHGSRAVGEPPLFLGFSVAAAIKDAIYTATGRSSYFPLRGPLTQPAILRHLQAAPTL